MDTNRTKIPYEEVQRIALRSCIINYFYVISHNVNYDLRSIEHESQIPYPYIVRSSYSDYGYLPFVLSLLRTSNYTLIIKDIGFEEGLPDGSWIDRSIRLLSNSSSSGIVSCASPYESKEKWQVDGCMLMRSIELRSIIVNTEFKKQTTDAFTYFSQAFLCIYNSKIQFVPCPTFRKPSFLLRSQDTDLLSHFNKSIQDCRQRLGLEKVECKGNWPRKRQISIVLSQFKRQFYMEQIKAILSSAEQIAEMVVYQNGLHINYQPLFNQFKNIKHIWATNWNSPFFFRHLIPLLFTSYYHIVFDDDIIPSQYTIKRILDVIDKYDAPSGVGARIITKMHYPESSFEFEFVDSNNEGDPVPVDYVIQVYAKTYVQSKVYWRYRPYTHRNGDDIHGSITWYMECHQRPYRNTFKTEGKYKNLGTDAVASFRTKTHNIVRPQTYRSWIMAGFKGIRDQTVRDRFPWTNQYWEQSYLRRIHKLCSYV